MSGHPLVAMAKALKEQAAAVAAPAPKPDAWRPAPGQLIGIWEGGDGVLWERPNKHPSRALKTDLLREMLGDRAFWDMRTESPEDPGRAKDAIIQRWVEGHGVTEYLFRWKEQLDDRLPH